MNLEFKFTGRARNTFIGAVIVGLILVIAGLFVDGLHERFWANYLLCTFYFTAISVTAVAWMGINYLANAGWAVALKRVTEAMSGFLWVGLGAFAILALCSLFEYHGHKQGLFGVYEWMHTEEAEIANDPVLVGKKAWLNTPFFIFRMFFYLAIWLWFRQQYRKFSILEGQHGGLLYYNKAFRLSAAFVPVYALTFCFASWDWIMSLQPHWYSTIFGPYMFAGALVSNFVLTAIIAHILKRNGYLEWVNENHFHDLGKFIFGFSIFWTYMWISQFLLIWYANLPEETIYYYIRMHGNWKILFFANLCINFVLPLLGLMMRDSKRNFNYLIGVGCIMLAGRYIDWYLGTMPATAGAESGFGLFEIGFFLLFAGLFGYTVAHQLSKAPLAAVNHPYFQESVHHEI